MPLTTLHPLLDMMLQVFNPVAGSQTGSKGYLTSPIRGVLLEAGFIPNSLVASAMTMQVALGNNVSNAASNFTTVIASTNASFSSTNLVEGGIASASPTTIATATVNPGDTIQITTSGGNTSAIGATLYAILRRA